MEELMDTIKTYIKESFIEYIADNCDEVDQTELYDSMINETTDTSDLPSYMPEPAEAMKENDPIMYRTGKNDYIDSISRDSGYVMINDELYNKDDIEDARFDFSSELSSEIDDFINDIEF